MKTMTKSGLLKSVFLLFFCFPLALNASNTDDRKITVAFEPSALQLSSPLPNQHIWASSFQIYSVDFLTLNEQLNGDDIPHRNDIQPSNNLIIQLPNPNGTFDTYRVFRNTTMHPDLAAAFPEIRTFDVISTSNRSKKGKIDVTPHGFHAMIFDNINGTFFIDPLQMGNTTQYMVYLKSDFVTNKVMACAHDEAEAIYSGDIIDNGDDIAISYASCSLRTYRLAVAATGEYTTFHGGTVALALAAQVTTMNRVNGVYEKEIAITMTIIANNNLIVYTNASTDPYTNGTPGTMINQNQTNITNVIGSANYDIGHVFGTNSGGLAGLGVVCNNSNKARGVTGSAAPVGDPFDIDYVAHEIGHQFGANHTQNNNCNSVANARYEPGSASTIMGYAGICAPNVQNNSDDYFHTRSLQEMGNFISGSGHTCPVLTSSGNSAPTISGTNGSISLPISTPFALTATATDPNAGNTLYYRWEQYNNEATTQPPLATATGGPNFRSFTSTTSPTRYFPSLTALANNGPFTWEVVPSVTRNMAFRVTVHDDHTVGGCSDYVSTSVSFTNTAGPFILTYPSATGIVWTGNTTQTVTWNVANTNNSAVNCQSVNIYLSTNGGTSYPTVLATNVPNNGSASVTVPNLPNTTSRVMVMAANGTFFDISDNNFTIVGAQDGYDLQLLNNTQSVCQGTSAFYDINVDQVGTFNGPVTLSVSGLPGGATTTWSANPVNTPGLSTLTITTSGVAAGVYNLTLNAVSTAGNQSLPLTLTVFDGAPSPVSPISPAGGVDGVSIPVTFTWGTSATPGAQYDIQISTTPLFTVITDFGVNLSSPTFTSSNLQPGITYYWKVRAVSSCGQSEYSSANSFTTANCYNFTANGLPINISASGTPSITSSIQVTQSGTISNVDVVSLIGTHAYMSDLTFTLTSPQGTSVVLFGGICGSQDNFNLNLSSSAAPGAIPCPPTTGLTYQPTQPLTNFVGQNMQGTWTLTVADNANQDGGALQSWGLNICSSDNNCLQATLPVVSGNTSVCVGDDVTLNVDFGELNDAEDWYWYAGNCNSGTLLGTGTQITFPVNASMNVFVAGAGGCVVPLECLMVEIVASDANPAFTHVGQALNAVQTFGQHQWLDCSTEPPTAISGATSPTYNLTSESGSYALQVSTGGCVKTSPCVVIDISSIESFGMNGVSIFPNPVTQSVFVSWNNQDLKMDEIKLYDASGKLVLVVPAALDGVEIDVQFLSSGMYYLELHSKDQIQYFKVLKN
jgi:subtilisin-like proprotein convertase family protein